MMRFLHLRGSFVLILTAAAALLARSGRAGASEGSPDVARQAAAAAVQAAEAAAGAAKLNLKQKEALRKNGLASQQEVLSAKERLAEAQARLAAAQTRLARSGPPRPATSPKVQALLQEKLDTCRAVVKAVEQSFKQGQATVAEVHQAVMQQLDAELDLCRSGAERVAVRERAVAAAKRSEESCVTRVAQGSASPLDGLRAKAVRLQLEIALERERLAAKPGEAEKKPAWKGSVPTEGEKTRLELARLAKVSLADVEKAALAAVKDRADAKRVVEIELEVRHGYLVYEVEVAVASQPGEIEVIVDAGTGKVLDVTSEGGKGREESHPAKGVSMSGTSPGAAPPVAPS